MTQRVVTRLIDDLDGGVAYETVTFGLDSHVYEIDLSDTNANKLRDTFADYVRAARKKGRIPAIDRVRRTRRHSAVSIHDQNQAIREWARTHGHDIGERGRIPVKIVKKYRHASAQ